MSSASPLAATLIFGIALSGCSADTGPEPAPSIIGVWNQGANLRDIVNNQTHIHTGYFTFTQKHAGFTGDGQQNGFCRAEAGDYAGPLATGIPFQIRDGVQDGDRVSFRSDLCTYEGTMSPDDEHISGTARCAYTEDGRDFVWTGEWLANREP